MKKIFNRIKHSISNHPKLYIILMILVLFLITFIIIRIADVYFKKTEIVNEASYIYVGSEKLDFDSSITINTKGEISSLNPSLNIDLITSPIYTESKIIFPNEMILVLPNDNYKVYRTLSYTYINISDDNIISKDYKNILNDYVIYDGGYVFFFSNDGELITEDTKISLGKYTTIIRDSNTVYYYDYTNKIYGSIEIKNKVLYKTPSTEIDILNKTIGSAGHLLASKTEYLNLLGNK